MRRSRRAGRDEMHAARVGDAKARLDEAGRALRDDERSSLELPDTNVPAGRTVLPRRRPAGPRRRRDLFAGDGST